MDQNLTMCWKRSPAILSSNQRTYYEKMIDTSLLILILEYLIEKDICQFDIANTNVKLRYSYLLLLTKMSHVLFCSIQPNESMLKWVIKRHIQVEKMVFNDKKNDPSDDWFIKIRNLSKLKEIKFRLTHQITDASVVSIMECTSLVSIELESCKITDTSIDKMLEETNKLDTISIMACTSITSKAINRLIQKVSLKKLDISYTATNNNTFKAIREGNSLKTLIIAWCNINDDGIIAISNVCPLLESINLCVSHNITDLSIIELSKKCPLLNNICLSSCSKITDLSYQSLALNCPLLTGPEYDKFRK